jgi:hypothetical protein
MTEIKKKFDKTLKLYTDLVNTLTESFNLGYMNVSKDEMNTLFIRLAKALSICLITDFEQKEKIKKIKK